MIIGNKEIIKAYYGEIELSKFIYNDIEFPFSSSPTWINGLKKIKWTDDDITRLQQDTGMSNPEPTRNDLLLVPMDPSKIKGQEHKLTYCPAMDTSSVTDMKQLFLGCWKMISLPLLDTSNVINMNGMFNMCSALQSIPKFDTHKVTNMDNMFELCKKIKIIPELDTSSVIYMGGMFWDVKH